MKDLVTYIKEAQYERNGDSPAEAAWKKMIGKSTNKAIVDFMKVALKDKEIQCGGSNYLMCLVNDNPKAPIVEIYASGADSVWTFRFAESGAFCQSDKKSASYISSMREDNPDKCFWLEDKIGQDWCNQIRKITDK